MAERKPTILHLDDDPRVYRPLGVALTLNGFDIRQADSIEKALAIIEADKDHNIRIALVDGDLGKGETGEMFIEQLKAGDRTDIVTIGNSGGRNVLGADLQSQKNDGLSSLYRMITRAQELSR